MARVNLSAHNPFLRSLVDTLQPDLLLNASRVRRHSHDALHLRVADVQNLICHEEPDTLGAWWHGQATHVGPEVVEMSHLGHGSVDVLVDVGQLFGLIEADVPWPLGDKSGIRVPRGIDAHGQDTKVVAFRIGVHEMDLRHAAPTIDRMLARSVDVPPDHIASEIVKGDVGKTRHCLAVVGGCEGRPVSPVEVIARHVLSIITECGSMHLGETLSGGQADGSLLSAVLAEGIFYRVRASVDVPTYSQKCDC